MQSSMVLNRCFDLYVEGGTVRQGLVLKECLACVLAPSTIGICALHKVVCKNLTSVGTEELRIVGSNRSSQWSQLVNMYWLIF